jgi:protein involved in ribonucleotide reduction
MVRVVYYSLTGNAERFVQELGAPSQSVQSATSDTGPFILITPTYTDTIPAPVRRYLDSLNELEMAQCIGVVGSGNKNFGRDYCAAARNIEREYGIPHVYSFEVNGLPQDVLAVQNIIDNYLQTSMPEPVLSGSREDYDMR